MNLKAILLLGWMTQTANAQTFSADFQFKRCLESYIQTGRNVGIAAGGILNGKSFAFYLGKESINGKPVGPSTVFQIGSVSKTFTSLILAKLATQNLLQLEDPISKFLPELSGASAPVREITLRQLSTHTSGLPRLPLKFSPSDLLNPYADYTDSMLIDSLRDPNLLEKLGPYPIQYSNWGAGLLGMILSRVTHENYDQMIRKEIGSALGLTNTGSLRTPGEILASAQGYDETLSPVPFWDFSALAGAGAVFSTLPDMLNYLGANVHPSSTSLEAPITLSHQEQARGTALNQGVPASANAGLGWFLDQWQNQTVIWHNGEVGGFFSFSAFKPQSEDRIEILTNSANPSIQNVLIQAMTGQACRLAKPSRPISLDSLKRFEGNFKFPDEAGLQVQFSVREFGEGGFLVANLNGANFRLEPISDFEFETDLGGVRATIRFIPKENGLVDDVRLKTMEAELSGSRVISK